jgi:hypothetical protein
LSRLGWAIAGVGLVLVLVAAGLIGDRDDSGETVPAGEWAQNVCGVIGVWRGEAEAITESFRLATDGSDATESGAPTPEGKVDAAQLALERAIEAADTLVEGIERAGVPDTAGGEEGAELISNWANGAKNDLEQAEDLLDEEGGSLEEDIERVVQAGQAIARVLESGRQVLATVGTTDPELEAAIRDASTCQELRAESA